MNVCKLISVTLFLFATLGISLAQEKLPNQSISITPCIDLQGGYETGIGTEYYFNSNHKVSFYGLFNYHFAKERWFGQSVDCKKALVEAGSKRYFNVVKQKFYPFVGLGLTAGVQNITQKTFNNYGESVVNDEQDPFILGAVCTIGLEYMFTTNVAVELISKFKYDRSIHYVLGGGLKFSF